MNHWGSHIPSSWMVHAGCFCCRHSLVYDYDVRICWVRAMECMCAQTRSGFILSPVRVLGNGVRTHVNSKGKIPFTGKFLLRGGSNPRRCIKQNSESNTLPTSYSGPRCCPVRHRSHHRKAGTVPVLQRICQAKHEQTAVFRLRTDTAACDRTWSELASRTLHSVIAQKQNRRSTTSSRTVPSGGNKDSSYGRRMSQPPTSCPAAGSMWTDGLSTADRPHKTKRIVVCWLLNVPATCKCIPWTGLLRQFDVLPHWDRSCRPNFPPHPVTVYWHRADQSQHWPCNTRRLAGQPLECQFFVSHWYDSTPKKSRDLPLSGQTP